MYRLDNRQDNTQDKYSLSAHSSNLSRSAIVDVIRDTVDIIDIMKPVYNFKAADDEPFWKKKDGQSDTGAGQ